MLWGRQTTCLLHDNICCVGTLRLLALCVRYHSGQREPERLDGLNWAKVGESWMPTPAGPFDEVVGAGADMHGARRHWVNRARGGSVGLFLAAVQCWILANPCCVILRHSCPQKIVSSWFEKLARWDTSIGERADLRRPNVEESQWASIPQHPCR